MKLDAAGLGALVAFACLGLVVLVPLDHDDPSASAVEQRPASVTRTASAAPSTSPRPTGSAAPSTNSAPSGDLGPGTCTPRPASVDPRADQAARCALARLDSWVDDDSFGVGQAVSLRGTWRQPLTALGRRQVAVVGFDAAELLQTPLAGIDRVPDLIDLARGGALLRATWHVGNPWTTGGDGDRNDVDLAALLDKRNAAQPFYRRFWVDGVDAVAAQFKRLARADVPVLFQPFDAASGVWFWWGAPNPATYRALWSAVQDRFAKDGVHNVVWVYSAAGSTVDPVALLPDVDVAGIETHDCEESIGWCLGAGEASNDVVGLTDYLRLADAAPRMALTEVGPYYSDGDWDPAIISRTIRAAGIHPAFALLGRDDAEGRKQIASLDGGLAWLSGCPEGVCSISSHPRTSTRR